MMERPEVHVEIVLGRKVVDVMGKLIGRLEEIVIEQDGEDWIVKEYLLGGYGALERWAGWTIGRAILDALPWVEPTIHRVPWDFMDFSDPLRPRVTVTRDELARRTPRAA